MTERYSHLAPEHLIESIKIVSFGSEPEKSNPVSNLKNHYEAENNNVILMNSATN